MFRDWVGGLFLVWVSHWAAVGLLQGDFLFFDVRARSWGPWHFVLWLGIALVLGLTRGRRE